MSDGTAEIKCLQCGQGVGPHERMNHTCSPLDKASAALADAGTPLVAERGAICSECKTGFDGMHDCSCGECKPLVADLHPTDVRVFKTGATRDSDEGKPRYHGYNCPLADRKFGEYMLGHQNVGTDKERPSDNWKKGMPLNESIESLIRHVKDLEMHHDGYSHLCREPNIHEVLGGIRANAMFYHSEICKKELCEACYYFNGQEKMCDHDGDCIKYSAYEENKP